MLSASLQRALSAAISYKSAKIRGQKHKTVEFIDACGKKEALVTKATKTGTEGLKRARRLQKDLLRELEKRQMLQHQGCEKTEKKKVERRMKKVPVKGGCDVEFPELSHGDVEMIDKLLGGHCVGFNIGHLWTMEDGGTALYSGHIEVFNRKSKEYEVAYWDPACYETYDVATEYDMKAIELATDLYFKDLTF